MAWASKVGREHDILKPEEVKTFIESTPDPMTKALIAFLYLAGSRISEVIAIRKDNITLIDGVLSIRLPIRKTREEIAPMHTIQIAEATPFLEYFISWWQACLKADAEPRLFPICKRTALRMVKRTDKSLWCHLFRHTRATRLADRGASEWEMMGWFGWRDTKTPMNYVHDSAGRVKRLVGMID